ncbi:MAG: ATP-grasp domain-containing protein [Deltaproteobacteria bacterium]|nr:ATP-grasp domain-containing protein [Deltaproteobacteria bacterium]
MNTAGGEARGCVVLVMHTTSYNVEAFVDACQNAGVQTVIASDRCHVLDGVWQWPAESLMIDFYDPIGAAASIAASLKASGLPPVRAVIPVGGEAAAVVASMAAERLGLRGNAPAAAEAAANKLRMRELCAAAAGRGEAIRVPAFRAFAFDADANGIASDVAQAIGWPCVVKPLLLSGSRGVIRADHPAGLRIALERLRKLMSAPALLKMKMSGGDSDCVASRQILIEAFVSGPEVAVEGLLTAGEMRTLAFFDKPDPLDGPYFEETLYVTPSRHASDVQADVERTVAIAARALGLVTGPVHAEVRLGPDGPVVIEVAARSIGGLCGRILRFGTGLSLEDLLIRHALGDFGVGEFSREHAAAGVMMIPIPRAGVLKDVQGIAAARAVSGIADLVVSAHLGETLVPLPEGASYLGFIFAKGGSPEDVEAALRTAHQHLAFEIAPLLPVA